MGHVRLIQGDAPEVLRGLPADHFDACLTDPPYGLRFMGRRWDHGVPSSEVWAAAARTMKPGANLFAFGGTRTYHRLAVAIEDGGLEIRDALLVPGLVWVYGSGMPKALNVGKAIDAAAGAERDREPDPRWVERYPNGPGGNLTGGDRSVTIHQAVRVRGNPLERTLPATPEDERWNGYRTTLKPAWEPVCWAMKPCEGGFAGNALAHGVAGLATEDVRSPGPTWSKTDGDEGSGFKMGKFLGHAGDGEPSRHEDRSGSGRYPSNLILLHHPGCRRAGTRRVVANTCSDVARSADMYGGGWKPRQLDEAHYADEDGLEEVEAWECVPGCPAAVIDAQSGVTRSFTSGGRRPGLDSRPGYNGGFGNAGGAHYYEDEGGASRYFRQVGWEDSEFELAVYYSAKSATAEKMVRGERVLHPTMKPLELTTYLARLMLPPERPREPRRLLVPYSGVASEVIGALRAGWEEVVAIELDQDGDGWVEIGERRIIDDAPLLNMVTVERWAA